ncbi:hypothetical protein PHLCEN_2v814 [Hermanssonia centrifuga]|uniref:Uncharacterized protein n=1 Tax=Hermanssonia centrifuga TaxID=98765 RepID=A0A2R6S4W7_9APHY|nr:hypothetical protein PHLCEN_2v814 [Hermanssonia centrifuga]
MSDSVYDQTSVHIFTLLVPLWGWYLGREHFSNMCGEGCIFFKVWDDVRSRTLRIKEENRHEKGLLSWIFRIKPRFIYVARCTVGVIQDDYVSLLVATHNEYSKALKQKKSNP